MGEKAYNLIGGIILVPEMIKKNTFLELIRSMHMELESILKDLDQQHMDAPGINDEWSIKDIIAHIAWYEAEMVEFLEKQSLQGSDWWNLPLDERNELIHQAYNSEPLDPVIKNEIITYMKMMNVLETVSENNLNNPADFAGMPSEWQPWSVIASNTYEHYPEHIQQIRNCLKK